MFAKNFNLSQNSGRFSNEDHKQTIAYQIIQKKFRFDVSDKKVLENFLSFKVRSPPIKNEPVPERSDNCY